MHPPPPPFHRSNVPGGPKTTPLPLQNKPPPITNNSIPTGIQQRGQPLMQPKTILKHPSQYKPTPPTQPQIQMQQQSQASQPPSLDAVKQSHAPPSLDAVKQSHANSLSSGHVPADKLKSTTTAESE